MGIVEQYLLQLNTEKRRWRRAAAILVVLSLFVATGVSWNLRMTGVTIANGATCGQEEHQHTEECAMEKVLICGYEIVPEDPTEPPTEESTEPPTEVPTEAPAEDPTEAPTEEPTEAPTEEPTEAPAEESSEEVPEAQDETVLDTLANMASELFSGFALRANAAEVPPEETTGETASEHVHTDECYEIVWLCELEEHIHELSCYSDATADVETAPIWEASLPVLTHNWADDLVQIARNQMGCGESERNYIVAEDGETRNGITRFGQWYGNPHGDWSAMFTLFCLYYAEVPQSAVPWSPGVYNMMRLMENAQIFQLPDENLGTKGNLLFLDTDGNGNADRIMIVCGSSGGQCTVIGGDWEDKVAMISIQASDTRILGYVNISQLQESRNAPQEPEVSEPTEPEEELPEEPGIYLDAEFTEEGILRLVAYTYNIEESMYTWQWQVSEDGNDPWTDIDGATELVCELEGTEENFNRYYRLLGQKVAVMQTFALRATGDEEENSDLAEDDDIIISEPIAPFSIDRNNGTYTIDVFAIPVDADGNRIAELQTTDLGSFSINRNSSRVTAESRFQDSLGTYVSAYFGTETNVARDNIASVNVTRTYSYSGYQYKLNYRVTGSDTDTTYLTNAESDASLYLRYIPTFTVTFASEGFESLKETVGYNATPTLTEPSTWTREGYTLLGWTIGDDEQHVYTYEEIMAMPVTKNVTYTAKWANEVTVSFDLGKYADALYPIAPMDIPYNSSISPLPAPIWKSETADMAFDGWYLDAELTQPVTADTKFTADTTIYAKWAEKDDG